MTPSTKATPRRVRPKVFAGVTLMSCVALTAVPVAHADTLDNIRGAVYGARDNSLCNPIQNSGELEGYAQEWVRTARALATLDTPTFPADAYNGDALGNIASADPTNTAISQLMSIATEDVQKCGYYQFGVGFVRDDVTDLSYVAVIVGKPDVPEPVQQPAPEPEPQPQPQPEPEPEPAPVQPTATVISDVDVYDVPGGEGTVTGILRGTAVVDLLGCQADNWCQVSGAAVPGGGGWVWGDFLQR